MNHLPPPCKGGCGRPLRPVGTTADRYPTTRTWLTKARGMCHTCYSKVPHMRRAAPSQCVDCEVPLRPRGTPEQEGVKVNAGNGRCEKCRGRWRRGTDPNNIRATPTACVCCDAKLRPRHRVEDDFPGTREHAGNGLCRGCEDKVRKGLVKANELQPVVYSEVLERERITVEVTDPGALRFRREREERRRKAERIAAARREAEAARRRFIATRKRTAA